MFVIAVTTQKKVITISPSHYWAPNLQLGLFFLSVAWEGSLRLEPSNGLSLRERSLILCWAVQMGETALGVELEEEKVTRLGLVIGEVDLMVQKVWGPPKMGDNLEIVPGMWSELCELFTDQRGVAMHREQGPCVGFGCSGFLLERQGLLEEERRRI